MSNTEFINKYPQSNAKFLPYIISDYSPVILCIPTNVKKKRKAFRFANFVADKKNFKNIVKEIWDNKVDGFHMFQVVKKLKLLKHPINKLGWEKGSVYQRV